MHVQVSTDNHIPGDERLTEYAQTVIGDSLARFQDRVTRVDVHLSDEIGTNKHAENDKRCSLEAHIAGHQPLGVTHHAATVRDSITGATHKLQRVLTDLVEKELDKRRG